MNLRIALAGLALALAVAAGAFGAHALRAVVDPRQIEVWQTAVLYHLVHGLALLVLAALIELRPSLRSLRLAWATIGTGLLLFSGSLYLIVLTGARWLGPITPLGGVAMIAGWLLLAGIGWKHWPHERHRT